MVVLFPVAALPERKKNTRKKKIPNVKKNKRRKEIRVYFTVHVIPMRVFLFYGVHLFYFTRNMSFYENIECVRIFFFINRDMRGFSAS